MANPNPSPSTRIGQPKGPKPGQTSEVTKVTIANAEAATRIRERLLRATEAQLVELSTEDVMALIEPAMLKLLADSEMRGFGSPQQAVDHTSSDGTMTPKDTSAAVLAALNRKHDDAG